MRRFLLLLFVLSAIVVAVGFGTAIGAHWAGIERDLTVSIDGDVVEGSAVAGVVGIVAALAVVIALVGAAFALVSVLVAVPLGLIAAAFAIVVGLSPLLVFVLLGFGAYVLLGRASRRRRDRSPDAVSSSAAAPPRSPI